MAIPLQSVVHPDVLQVFVARTPSGPVTDTLFICTGTAVFTAAGNDDRTDLVDTLEFLLPGEDGNPLDVGGGQIFDSVVTASLANLDNTGTDNGLWSIDSAEISLGEPDRGQSQVFVKAHIHVHGATGIHLNGMAYQVTLQVGPPSPPIG
jgi:hypothetical protein